MIDKKFLELERRLHVLLQFQLGGSISLTAGLDISMNITQPKKCSN